jgi:hypothetical protein
MDKDMQSRLGRAVSTWACNLEIDMQPGHGHAAWTWTCTLNFEHGHRHRHGHRHGQGYGRDTTNWTGEIGRFHMLM